MKKNKIGIFAFLALYGCQCGSEIKPSSVKQTEKKAFLTYLERSRALLPQGFSINHMKAMIEEDDIDAASRYVNAALNSCNKSPFLHLINGYLYDEKANRGDNSAPELADVAYQTAYNLDPTQWYIVFLFGRSKLKNNDFREAQRILADALILKPDSPQILHSLAYASYYIKDLRVAAGSIKKAVTLAPKDPVINRAAAIIFAAAGQKELSQKYFNVYKDLAGKEYRDVNFIAQRLTDWDNMHQKAALQKTGPAAPVDENPATSTEGSSPLNPKDAKEIQASQATANQEAAGVAQQKGEVGPVQQGENVKAPGKAAQKPATEPSCATKEEKYLPIIIDCYALRLSEEFLTGKGINVLDTLANNLTISVGATSTGGLSGYSKQLTNPLNGVPGGKDIGNNFLSKGFNCVLGSSVIKYNINIANSTRTSIEVLGRPSVATMLGRPAYFLSGDQIIGAVQGTISGGSAITTDVGMKVEITPITLTGKNKVILQVTVTGSVFSKEPTTDAGLNEQLLKVGKSKMSTTLKAGFDQTVMIGGIYERVNISTKSHVPLLGDLPIIQYLFAREDTICEIKSVLYLLTPRRGGLVKKCTDDIGTCSMGQGSIVQRLESRGVLAIGEYSTLHYILNYMLTSPFFYDFRTGDLMPPYYGEECTNLNRKLDELLAFVYY